MQLNNITLSEYMNLDVDAQVEYDFFIKYCTPVDKFNIGDMTAQSFGVVKDLQFDLSDGIGWSQIAEYIMKLTKKEAKNIPILDLSRFWKYIQSEIERITEIESLTLAYTATDKEIAAGIDELNVLGIYMQIRQLTGGDVTKNEQVRNTRYDECFTELVACKLLYEYEMRYTKLMRDDK